MSFGSHPLSVALAVVALAGAVFAVLQARSLGHQRIAMGSVAFAALVVVGLLGYAGTWNLRWMRAEEYEGDALALAVLSPGIVGVVTALLTRQVVVGAIVAAALVGGGFCALTAAHSHWYWEFVSVCIGGLVLTGLGLSISRRKHREWSQSVGILVGGFGVCAVVAGSILFAAWASWKP